ncbi:hypothetical protein CAPTEDRAFT_199622 [Capitella teleta]|uniref:BTB domain-containing protein n=1 Tax=Capitella teleta TaxID=283909 RepID=R7U8E1_CAPTE|nr:hypothetical protein CAPTEDRAFT_199622 [Capitella teleta]|eukprot:ELU02650.1 hypothetical protein CAPTEDRAFT_199622 [Capitella teleta]
MSRSGLKERRKKEKRKKKKVHLDFTNSEMMRKLVDYFYSGEIDINSDNVDDKITEIGFLYLDDLKTHCGTFMTSQVDSSNCLAFYRCTRLLGHIESETFMVNSTCIELFRKADPIKSVYNMVYIQSKVQDLFHAKGTKQPTNQEFDPIWDNWQLKQSVPGVCESGAAVSLNTSIFVVGGAERACFRYTPTTDTWIVL